MEARTPFIISKLNALADEKAAQILAKARTVLANSEATKGLINSLEITVKHGDADNDPVIYFSFKDEGRFLDYKKPVWNKVPEISKMVEWVKAKGVSNFRYVSGVGKTKMDDEKKALKIAEGVAWAMRKHEIKWKPKGWKRKTLVALLKELNQQTVDVWDEGIRVGLEEALTS